jgi:hypothetical protein
MVTFPRGPHDDQVDSTSQFLESLNYPCGMEPWFVQMRAWQETQRPPEQPRIDPDLAEIWRRQPIAYIGPKKNGIRRETFVFENGEQLTRNAPPPWGVAA